MKNIYVIDDDEATLALIRRILQEDSFKVTCFSSSLKALEALGETAGKLPAPDLIILDIQMPDFDGHEILKLRQGSEDFLEIPVVIISGDDSLETLMEVLGKQAAGFCTKPIDRQHLLQVVHQCFEAATS